VIHRLGLILKPRPRLNIHQWANEYRFLAKGVSAKSKFGDTKYSTSYAPHQIKPQESCTDPTVQVTVLDMASQVGGKTEILLNVIGYHMHWQPTNIVVMYPTIDSAEKFSKKKLSPCINATPSLSGIVSPSRTRDSGNTILVKDFLGGSVFLVGANSPPSLRGASGEVLIADEIDAYDAEAGTEGDPLELLWKRGESYPDCVKVVGSTPTIEGMSRIDGLMKETDYQMWFMPCPRCSTSQVFMWSHVQWPKNSPELAFYECDKCNAQLTDGDRLWMYYHGDWKPTMPFKGKRGFHLSGIYAPWPHQKGFRSRLHQMADESIRAAKKPTTLKVWINTFLCETWKLKTETVEAGEVASRCELYPATPLPEKVLCVVGAADVQADRIEAQIVGCGENNEIWALQYSVFMGDTDSAPVWQALDQFINQRFAHLSGASLPVACFLVDMGFRPKQVVKFTKARQGNRVYACAGSKTAWPTWLVKRPTKSTIRQATKFEISGDVAKEIIYHRLINIKSAGPGFIHFPIGLGFDDEYFRQLSAEKLVTEIDENGISTKKVWKKQRDRNEALDIMVYTLGAIEVLNPNWKALAKGLAIKPEKGINTNADAAPPEPPTPERAPVVVPNKRAFPVRRSGGGGGWVNGWRR
jgi:phage terminase large subunit GpA-like protein